MNQDAGWQKGAHIKYTLSIEGGVKIPAVVCIIYLGVVVFPTSPISRIGILIISIMPAGILAQATCRYADCCDRKKKVCPMNSPGSLNL